MEGFEIEKRKTDVAGILSDNKQFIYPIIMYVAGVISGTVLFKNANSTFLSIISDIFSSSSISFQAMLVNHFCLYFSVFTIAVLFGMCLIGFPIVNIITICIGIEVGIKLCYYYLTYSAKGIGYSILMIIPETAVFVTIIIFTLVKSNALSKAMYMIISKKEGMIEEINLKSYLKSFVLYAFIIMIVSILNASLNYFFSSIISLA